MADSLQIPGGSFGFSAGHYGGVFLGGAGQDTLVFDHQNATDTAQMYVGLSSGTALFGNNVGSPMVQFADVGSATYSLTWERLEMMGDSNDFVVVGSGLQDRDDSAAARKLDIKISSKSTWGVVTTSCMSLTHRSLSYLGFEQDRRPYGDALQFWQRYDDRRQLATR